KSAVRNESGARETNIRRHAHSSPGIRTHRHRAGSHALLCADVRHHFDGGPPAAFVGRVASVFVGIAGRLGTVSTFDGIAPGFAASVPATGAAMMPRR